jgi:hypothetical protein
MATQLMKEEARTAASPLALGLSCVAARTGARGPAGNELRPLTERVTARDGDPRRAIAALATMLSRDDLRHYRAVPGVGAERSEWTR